jgi:4-hydroxy-tetrahydrodipicolinate reductase
MSGSIYSEGEVDVNEWKIFGEPDLNLTNIDVPTRLVTCSTAVNRIPDVINAKPGLITLNQLPQPRYKHHSLEKYTPSLLKI